ADRVRQVDDVGPRGDRLTADARDEAWVGAGGVLARELDLVGLRSRKGNGPGSLRDDLVGLEAQLPLHVDRAGGEEDVQTGAPRMGRRLRARVDVLASRPAERGDRRAASDAGDRLNALEVSWGRRREAGFDHVHPEALELLRDLRLLVRLQGDARRLLAVAKRGVEDCDPARTH